MLENEAKQKQIVDSKAVQYSIAEAIGEIGKWQLWIYLIVFLAKVPIAWHQMSIIFLAPPMDFLCADIEESIKNLCYSNCSVYNYDHSIFGDTIVSEWNLICKREWLKNFTQTIFMFGILIGNMIFGHVADRLVEHFVN